MAPAARCTASSHIIPLLALCALETLHSLCAPLLTAFPHYLKSYDPFLLFPLLLTARPFRLRNY